MGYTNLYVSYHPIKIQANSTGVIIPIFWPRYSSIIEDILVISCGDIWFTLHVLREVLEKLREIRKHTPGWWWYQNFCTRKISFYKSSSKSKWARPWKTLNSSNLEYSQKKGTNSDIWALDRKMFWQNHFGKKQIKGKWMYSLLQNQWVIGSKQQLSCNLVKWSQTFDWKILQIFVKKFVRKS